MPLLQIFVFPKQEKEDEKSSRLVKQRMMLRFVTELVLLGIYSDLNLVFQLLKDIVTSFLFFFSGLLVCDVDIPSVLLQIQSEKDPLVVLPLVASFSKKYSEELTGIEPRNIGGNERVPLSFDSVSFFSVANPVNHCRASQYSQRRTVLFLRQRKSPSPPC